MKSVNHHATLTPCRECERLKLGLRIAQTERPSDVARWEDLLRRHLGARLNGDQPRLFGARERDKAGAR